MAIGYSEDSIIDNQAKFDPRTSLRIPVGDIYQTITFPSSNSLAMFKVLHSNFGQTLSPSDIFSKAGLPFAVVQLSKRIVNINSSIESVGLKVINEYGVGYRLVKADDQEKITPVKVRTLMLENGINITIQCGEVAFQVLELLSKSDGLTAQEIANEIPLDKAATAQQYMSVLRRELRKQHWDIVRYITQDGSKIYKLVSNEM